MKKVYFACSITGGRENALAYPVIVEHIQKAGGKVLSEVFTSSEIDASKGFSLDPNATPADIWKWDLDWVREADVIIAEVTQPSLGVGYEIAKAHEWNKPVLALYRPTEGKKLSSMIVGSPNVQVLEYVDVADLVEPIARFINS